MTRHPHKPALRLQAWAPGWLPEPPSLPEECWLWFSGGHLGVPLGVEGHAFYLLGVARSHTQTCLQGPSWDVPQHSWCSPQAQEQEGDPSTHPTPRLTFLSADRQQGRQGYHPVLCGVPEASRGDPGQGSEQVRATAGWGLGGPGSVLGACGPHRPIPPEFSGKQVPESQEGGKVTRPWRREGEGGSGLLAHLTLALPPPRGVGPGSSPPPPRPMQVPLRKQRPETVQVLAAEGSGAPGLWAEAGQGAKIAEPDRGRLVTPGPTAQRWDGATGSEGSPVSSQKLLRSAGGPEQRAGFSGLKSTDG